MAHVYLANFQCFYHPFYPYINLNLRYNHNIPKVDTQFLPKSKKINNSAMIWTLLSSVNIVVNFETRLYALRNVKAWTRHYTYKSIPI